MVSPPASRQRVRKRFLPNGVTILQQDNPFSRTFCAGVWIKVGSRHEEEGEEGLCHFLEHMFFKGTSSRSQFEISREIERVGGSLDAFTTKEQICLYAQVLDEHRELALELLADILVNSTFPPDQIRLEKRVVLEEIGDVLDSPEEIVHELFGSTVFPDHPLGRPILGRRSTVSRFSRRRLIDFSRRIIRGRGVILSVYGNIDIGSLSRRAMELFDLPRGRPRVRASRPGPHRPKRIHLRRDLHQQHVCLGGRGLSLRSQARFAQMVLVTLLGGGMTSRLFQRLREELGLVYNVYSFSEYGKDAGLLGAYFSVNPSGTGDAIAAALDEMNKIRAGEFRKGELEETKEYLKGRALLGLETSSARMMRQARNEIYFGRQIGENELLRNIDRVTPAQVRSIAKRLLDPERLTIVSAGPSSSGLFRR